MKFSSLSKNKLSVFTILFLLIALLFARFLKPSFNTHDQLAILSWDVFGYYLYLPATFIYHDLSQLSFVPAVFKEYAPAGGFVQAMHLENDNYVIQYTYGMSLLYSPFFFIGHLAAKMFHYQMDGFSAPYQLSIALGSIVYAITGLIVLRKVLLNFFSDKITSIVLLIIVLGTNYFNYTAIEGAMTHNYLFILYAFILFFTIRWHKNHELKDACLLALFSGVAVLIRPVELVALFIPLLWRVKNISDLKERLKILWIYRKQLFIFSFIMFFIGLPQFLYWKKMSGYFLFDSYDSRYNWFEFSTPHIYNVLVHFKKGWLIYTPVIIFSIIGFRMVYKEQKEIFYPFIVYLVVNLYLVSSWNNWWYAGSFGMRALVQSYAVLSIPLGFFIKGISSDKYKSILTGVAVVFFIWLNLFQTWQYHVGILHYEEMNQRYYFAIFGKTNPTRADYNLLDVKKVIRDDSKFEKRMIAKIDFENIADTSVLKNITNENSYSGKYSFKTNKEVKYSYALKIPLNELNAKDGSSIRSSVRAFQKWGVWGSKLVMSFEKNNQPFKWEGIRMQSKLFQPGNWNKIYFETEIPDSIHPVDELKIYVLNEGGMEILLDDFEVELLEPKNN